MNQSTLKHYAKALFSFGEENNKVDLYGDGLAFISAVLEKTPEYTRFLSSPEVSYAEKEKTLKEHFGDKVDIAVLGFMTVLIKKKAIKDIGFIHKEYVHLIHLRDGILEGRIYSPYPLSEEEMSQLETVFSKKYGKKVVFRTIIDHRVIAGMRIYVDDTLYDYSISTQLDTIKDKMLLDKKQS